MAANEDLIALFGELALLTKLEEGSPQAFRVRAYEAAALALESLGRNAVEMSHDELVAVKGIGDSIATRIREYAQTGRIARLEELRSHYPPAFLELTRIPGLGPKTLVLLRSRLGVESVEDLRAAIADHKLRDLPGLGEKSEAKIAHALDRLGLHGKERRTPIADVMPVARRVVAALEELGDVKSIRYCGSLRRLSETIGDVDIVVASRRPAPIMERFVSLPVVEEVIAHGDTKSAILTRAGLQVDLRVVTPAQFGAASLYFTGSKAHNIAIRQLALERGWTLNEYGLTDVDTGAVIASKTEEEIYAALGLQPVPPPMRENTGEVELAAAGELPRVPRPSDMRGDLHDHTVRSGDGRSTLEDMVAAAAGRGYRYLAITDHGEDLTINGVSREEMLRQRQEIEYLREQYPKMAILHGSELNIGPEGGLDYDDEFLAGFDWCVASVHSSFDLPPARQTERLLKAMAHPAVNVIGHLSGRMIGTRPGIEFDVDAVFEAAAATGTALEINAALERLDASAEVLRRAAAHRDVVFVISTDAHHTTELDRMQWGVFNAQRGWVDKARVANTWPQKKFLAWTRRKST